MIKKDTCEIYSYDIKKVIQIQDQLQDIDVVSVTRMLKALADVNRAKIIFALCAEEKLCVCDLAIIIEASVATTSHHLRTLHKQGLVKSKKEGKLVFYSLDDEHVEQIMSIALTHKEEVKSNV